MPGHGRGYGMSSSHRDSPKRASFLANGVVHPPHMVEPGREGYRTPTVEDFERTRLSRRSIDSAADYGSVSNSRRSSIAGSTGGTVLSPTVLSPRLKNDGPNPYLLSRHISTVAAVREESDRANRGSVSSISSTPSVSSVTSTTSTVLGNATPPTALDRVKSQPAEVEPETELPLALSLRQRLKHFTWSFFTITMATGGIANVLCAVPFQFPGLHVLGLIFFILNVVLFIFNVVCISLRFHFHPGTFRNSFAHPTESLFAPAAVVSFGTVLLNISQYGAGHVGEWLNTVATVLFWVDLALAFVASFGTYLLFWSTQSYTIANMTPIWIFPAYPLLIIGPHGATLSRSLSPYASAQILVGAFTAQGIGFLVSLMIFSAYIYRLMTQKLPRERLRPGMFVSVGPCAFTASGLAGMASHAQRTWDGTDFMGNGELAAMILRVIADWAALWLWGLSLWFFFIALFAHYHFVLGPRRMPFAMTWFSFVFPQTALVTSTFNVAAAFELYPLQIVGCVMTVLLIAMWLFVVFMMIRALYRKKLLWPQRGEDKNEGGFKDTSAESTGVLRRTQTQDAAEKV